MTRRVPCDDNMAEGGRPQSVDPVEEELADITRPGFGEELEDWWGSLGREQQIELGWGDEEADAYEKQRKQRRQRQKYEAGEAFDADADGIVTSPGYYQGWDAQAAVDDMQRRGLKVKLKQT